MFADNFVQDIPNFRALLFNDFLGLFHGAGKTFGIKARIDKRLEQLQSHFLGQATLMQHQFWANHDNGTTRIIDPFTEQVLTETALLTFKHVGHGFKRTFVRASNHATTTTIVDQRINALLQHTFFVTDNNVRRTEFDQAFQAVITVDNPAV